MRRALYLTRRGFSQSSHRRESYLSPSQSISWKPRNLPPPPAYSLNPNRFQLGASSYGAAAAAAGAAAGAEDSSFPKDNDKSHHLHDEALISAMQKAAEDEDALEIPKLVQLPGSSLPDYMEVTLPNEMDPPMYVPPSSLEEELKSRLVEGGNWNPEAPLAWAQTFGRRSRETAQTLAPKVKLSKDDPNCFDVSNITSPGATIVRTREHARQVLEILNNAPPNVFHACDTEVMEIDLKSEGPVGNGYVTCVSIYSGPDFDYGDGPGTALWIDNLDDAAGLLQEFKGWFENPKHKKVWHNYGFDRHVMWNEGIDCQGFGGDTMHMARLQDTSRMKSESGLGYSLEALTDKLLDKRKKPMKELFGVKRLRKDGSEGAIVDLPPLQVLQRDPKYRANFITYSAYDAKGTWDLREKLQELLEKMPWLRGKNLYDYYEMHMREFANVLTDMERRGMRVDARDYLASVEVQARKDRAEHVRKFRTWAAEQIGPDGLALNPASSVQLTTFLFGGAKNFKTKQPSETQRVFKVAREEIPDDAMDAFAKRDGEEKAGAGNTALARDDFDQMTAAQLKIVCKQMGLKVSGKKIELQERLRGYFLAQTHREASPEESSMVEIDDIDSMSDDDIRSALVARGLGSKLTSSETRKQLETLLREDCAYAFELLSASSPKDKNGYESISQALEAAAAKDGSKLREILNEARQKANAKPKFVDVTVTSIEMEPIKYTDSGAASCTADVIRALAGDPFGDEPKYGTAYKFFGGGKEGHEACEALYSLGAIGSIDTMIANFLTSLQSLCDEQNRVHCSVNLNTETGRLSSRRPNLQNQPALEKDKYKIRKAFEASEGNSLIVADYGQLELRLLASMTKCKSMIEAFKAGGDFHSRTAIDMFDYVKKQVEEGEVLLEWDHSQGECPKPLVKDIFASERRKAKTLNFSIAYGKTAHGLSQDWGVSKKEAESMLQAWYDARPEVRKWQHTTKQTAKDKGITRTLMGRYRQLPNAKSNNRALASGAERASINTPIQGGAADVAMMAMIKINTNEKLKRLGWILLMQIHDEMILEGPEETAEEAFEVVLDCMQHPWVFGLEETAVPLLVDGSYEHKSWFDAK